ncbi:NAD-dependent epimerase/dehydratase family protein [Nitratireductor luteus]|uniref:NAD-dependent epimerase/dehydratase family protein n=1 Tax=Nitratireductor luteus TaxID=2976980 RepID=UPI00224051C3|nr:NAD(P)-dependent oxidoreductase [Nitratireductor luteus]
MAAPRSIVTGGTGYVGRFIVEAFLRAGHEVTVMGRRPPAEGFFSRAIAFVPLDLKHSAIDRTAFARADFLVHGAFDHEPGKYRGGEGDDPAGFRRRNLDGSLALFDAARAAGVSRTVFLSSRAVYGPRTAGVRLAETDPARPDTLYGEIKLEAETALRTIGGVSLRVTGVYGPAGVGKTHKWAGLFRDYLGGKPISPHVGTEVHGDDVAAAVLLVLEVGAAEAEGEIFNVSDIVVDRRDLLAIVQRQAGCQHQLPEAADVSSVNAMETAKLQSLGWRPGGAALLEKTVPALVFTD